MGGTEADDTDDLGEMDGIDDRPLPEFLPPPDQLLRREDTVKGRLVLSRSSVEFSIQSCKDQCIVCLLYTSPSPRD